MHGVIFLELRKYVSARMGEGAWDSCERLSPREVVVHYTSERRMCGLARGICRGLSSHFGETIAITESMCMLEGAPECRISVRLTT